MDEFKLKDMDLFELYYFLCVCLFHDEETVPYEIDDVWNEINKYYYLEKGYSLDVNNEEQLIILFKFVRDNVRYQLLDELMVHVYSRLLNKEEIVDYRDKFFANNLFQMREIMDYEQEYIEDNIGDFSGYIPEISKEETIAHVKNILKEIDPSGEWLNIYNKAIDDDKIIYLNELSDVEEEIVKKKLGLKSFGEMINSCFCSENEMYILLTYNNNLDDVTTTVHEIIHYISMVKSNGKQPRIILREMPSMFFELYALNYLRKLGYPDYILASINDDRLKNMNDFIKDVINMTDYLIELVVDGQISPNGEDHKCDNSTYELINNPYIYHRSYPYIIGNFLATEGMEKAMYYPEFVADIKKVTERLSTVNPYDVFKMVDYKCMHDLVRTTNKKRTRKK